MKDNHWRMNNHHGWMEMIHWTHSQIPRFNPGASVVIVDTTDRIEPPQNFKEAMRSPFAARWLEACQEEMDAQVNNKTWDLIDNPGDHPVLTGKWVFAVKIISPTQVRFKARWVARGFTQQYGIDYKETFAAVINTKAWHILLALAAATGYKTGNMMCQMHF